MSDSVKTYTVGEIMRLFDLETGGDAWDLILTKGWDHDNSANGRTWQVTIPSEDMP